MGATASAAAATVATRMPLTEVVARSYIITITTTTITTPRGVSMTTDGNANNEIKSSRACRTYIQGATRIFTSCGLTLGDM